MRLSLPLVCFVLLFSMSADAQVAFQDAKGIRDHCISQAGSTFSFKTDPASVSTLAAYLKNYLPEDVKNNPALTEDVVFAQFVNNPFFGAEIQALRAGGASPAIPGTIQSAVNKLGGLNVTTVADGIARFLVERTKTELDVYFFERFKEFLESKDFGGDLKILFPNTHSVMSVAGEEIYNYQIYLQALREAFAHDLSGLLKNTNEWINQRSPGALVTLIQQTTLYPYLQLSLHVAVDVESGKHPGDILQELQTRDFSAGSTWGEFGAILKVSNLFSQSLRSTGSDRYWIADDEFIAFRNLNFTRLYFGLIYHQAEGMGVAVHGTQLTAVLRQFVSQLNVGAQAVNSLRPLLTRTDQILERLKSETEQSVAENYVRLGNSVLDIAAAINSALLSSTNQTLLPQDVVQDAQFFFTHSANLLADIRTKSYSAGVIELSLIVKKIDGGRNTQFVNGLIKYGSFMAAVATAETSEEVKQAIEVVALPPGSYRVKRESRANVSLNGYVGFYGGNEYMPASETENRFSMGLVAPVGFAFSWGGWKEKEGRGGKSFTIFTSIIDLGTLASFRFKDDNTSVASDIELKDIVAPGVFFIHGFGKSPISAGLGAQIGPSLRNVDAAGAAEINKDYYTRVAAFLAVDIPMFNLYNRKDKKK